MAGVQHADALADACHFALSLRHTLPNVICDQKTSRFSRDTNEAQRLRDIITAHVIYEDGIERYSNVKIDGKRASERDAESLDLYTKGEFGSDLVFALSAANHPSYSFVRKDHISSRKAFVYAVRVARKNNHGWKIKAGNRHTFPEFKATIWVDETTHQVLRLDILPVLEQGFPITRLHTTTDYELLLLGDGTSFVLPVKSESHSCVSNDERNYVVFCTSNFLTFKNCHKFSAKSQIITDLDITPK